MKISLRWLNDYVAITLPADKLAHRLTLAGLEVEKIEHLADDVMMELEITPNRPDCLNMLGIARELSAILNKNLKVPKEIKRAAIKNKCLIEISDREGCSRYVGIVVKGVQVGPSPEWLQQRLIAIGLRPINNIVDITNFVLMETGQPLHAFDYDCLKEGKIVVRRARTAEKLKTLDGVERLLDPSILVIADAKDAVALAGIMGGEGSEVTTKTKNILLESAYFNPIVIRRGGRKLGLSTDASYRFERGVDIDKVDQAANRAIALIKEIAGGEIFQASDIYPAKGKKTIKPVSVNLLEMENLLGSPLTVRQCKNILQKLGFRVSVKGKNGLTAIPPSFRSDIKRAEDVIEEVGRIIGYDNLASSLPRITVSEMPVSRRRTVKEHLRQVMTGMGFYEILTYTLTNQAALEKTLLGDLPVVRVQNPLTQEQEMMRPAILPSFLSAVLVNFNRGQKGLRFFEIGKEYSPDGKEREKLAILLTAEEEKDWRILQKLPKDFYDMKGVVFNALSNLGAETASFVLKEQKIFSSGESAAIECAGQQIGFIGKLSKEILRNWDIKHTEILFAQLDLERFYEQKPSVPAFVPLVTYPSVTRDISLAVKQEISFQQIRDIAREKGGELLQDLRFQELYLGEKIPAGHKGYVFSLVYQSSSRTLTEEEINKTHAAVCRAFIEKLGAVIR